MEFAEFFERTAPPLVRLCFLTTLDREAAADAAQEALSRAWRDWHRIGADSSDPAAWTRTVALNLCRNRWRRLASQARLARRAYTDDLRSDVTFVRSASAPGGQHCETPIDVPDGDSTRVTLLFSHDERGACASVAAASFEADRLLGMPRGLPAPGFVGLTENEAIDEAATRGWTVRVLARDGEGQPRTADYQPERVNLVLEDGRVAAAARS